MIELLVHYFEDCGFQVHVREGILLIRKRVGDRVIGYSWAISQLELQNSRCDIFLLQEADRIIAQLNEAIEKEMDNCKS